MSNQLSPLGNCCNGQVPATAIMVSGEGPTAPDGIKVLSPAFVRAQEDGAQPLGNCCNGTVSTA